MTAWSALRRAIVSLCLLAVVGGWAQAQLLASPLKMTKASARGRDTYWFRNTSTVPVTIRVTARATRIACNRSLPEVMVVPAGRKVEGPSFWRQQRNVPGSYKINYAYRFGDYRVEAPSGAFQLPWEKGQAYECIQGWNGAFSHREMSKYGTDFALPLGSPVMASRDGLVVRLQAGFTRGGRDKQLVGRDNRVILAHKDGTLTRYSHLKPRGIMVRLGQQVTAGQLLGYSGNTGYSSGPHLHFDVARPGTDSRLSLQTMKFEFIRGKSRFRPVQGKTYRR